MSTSQRTVLWLGLILVALNLYLKWSSIKTIIFTGAGLTSSSSSSSSGAASNTPAPGVKLPNPTPNASPTPTSVIV